MSFRTALDATAIAQLVGRMVRAPLARRVGTDDFLNTVALFLPHYDQGGVDAIIKKLTEADGERAPVDFEKRGDVIELLKDGDLQACFDAYKALPSYTIPRSRRTSEVRRLMKLARLLANDDLESAAIQVSTNALVEVLEDAERRLRSDPDYKQEVAGQASVRIRLVDWEIGSQESNEGFIDLDLSDENLEDVFDIAGRKLGEGLHRVYWRARCKRNSKLSKRAKLEAFALSHRPDIVQKLNQVAKKLTQDWLRTKHKAIGDLPDGEKQRYVEIYGLASEPELLPSLSPPDVWRTARADELWKLHMYVDDKGDFPARLNKWEGPTLREEVDEKPDLVGWLRNPSRKDWAVCVPYMDAGQVRGMYPDFVVFRLVHGEVRAHIVDPHSLHLPDAAAKAAGMARYAEKHAQDLAGIDLIIVDEGRTVRLDLTDEATRERVRAVQTKEHLALLFQLA